MVMVKNRKILLAKSESTYGSDPTPTAASNAILTVDLGVKDTFEAVERNVQVASLSKKNSVGATRFCEVTFQAELVGSGTAGTAPRIGTLLKACAFAETVSVGSSVVYTPNSSPIASCTLYVFQDGWKQVISGCVGTAKIMLAAGQPPMIEFTMKGKYGAKSDSAIPTPTYESTIESLPICKSAALTVSGITDLIVQSIEIDVNNTVAMRPSINQAYAVHGFYVTDRRPNMTLNPEAVSIATADWRSKVLTTPFAVTWSIGSTAGNIIDFSVPKFNIMDIETADRDMLVVENLKGEMAANSGSGDDELSITFR